MVGRLFGGQSKTWWRQCYLFEQSLALFRRRSSHASLLLQAVALGFQFMQLVVQTHWKQTSSGDFLYPFTLTTLKWNEALSTCAESTLTDIACQTRDTKTKTRLFLTRWWGVGAWWGGGGGWNTRTHTEQDRETETKTKRKLKKLTCFLFDLWLWQFLKKYEQKWTNMEHFTMKTNHNQEKITIPLYPSAGFTQTDTYRSISFGTIRNMNYQELHV